MSSGFPEVQNARRTFSAGFQSHLQIHSSKPGCLQARMSHFCSNKFFQLKCLSAGNSSFKTSSVLQLAYRPSLLVGSFSPVPQGHPFRVTRRRNILQADAVQLTAEPLCPPEACFTITHLCEHHLRVTRWGSALRPMRSDLLGRAPLSVWSLSPSTSRFSQHHLHVERHGNVLRR